MENFWDKVIGLLTTAGGKILLAAVVFFAGRIVIKYVLRAVDKLKARGKLDPTVQSFLSSLIRIGLYAMLLIAIIQVLGIPMTSVLTVLASAGLAVGLALQGALSNCAGGLMILLFKPFRVGDYITAAGAEGTVKEITVFYTTLLTVDNKRITVPNGTMMNANVVNYSSEDLRRVDLYFKAARGSDTNLVEGVMRQTAENTPLALTTQEIFARFNGCTDNGMEFLLKVWCRSGDYWTLYYDLLGRVNAAFAQAGIAAPVTPLDVNLSR